MYKIFDSSSVALVAQMEEFIKNHPNGHFLQLPQWAKAKSRWQWRGILVYQDRLPIAAMSVLIRPLPLGYSLLYAPRGPVCDRSNPQILETLSNAASQIAKESRALLLFLDPDEPDTNPIFRSALHKLGFREKTDDGFGNIQAQHVFRLDLTGADADGTFRAFSSKTRYNIRLSQRKGVTIRTFSGADSIPKDTLLAFSKMMQETGRRDGFWVRDEAYYSGVLQALREDALLLIAYYQEQPIAAAVESFCGKKAWYLYGASANTHRDKMPNYLLQWTMIRQAIERGCVFYDFRGVPGNPERDNPLYGLYRFKSGFSGTFTKFSGLFMCFYHPILSRLFVKAWALRKLLSKIVTPHP